MELGPAGRSRARKTNQGFAIRMNQGLVGRVRARGTKQGPAKRMRAPQDEAESPGRIRAPRNESGSPMDSSPMDETRAKE